MNVFAGQPFNDRFSYRRDVQPERDITNWMMTDEELHMGFANARVQLDLQCRQLSAFVGHHGKSVSGTDLLFYYNFDNYYFICNY